MNTLTTSRVTQPCLPRVEFTVMHSCFRLSNSPFHFNNHFLPTIIQNMAFLLATTLISMSAAYTPGATVYTAPPGFPTALFSSYYVPASPSQEPQPAIFDPLLNFTYPRNLTDPRSIPAFDPDPVYYPQPIEFYLNGTEIVKTALADIQTILSSSTSDCDKCLASLKVGQHVRDGPSRF